MLLKGPRKLRANFRRSATERAAGQILVESVVALTIFAPLIIFIIWGIIEITYVYVIGTHMTEAAQLAAQALGSQYQRDQSIEHSPSRQNAILSNVRISGMVHTNAQFCIDKWQTSKQPRSVTVICSYLPGEGDPPLPAFPNPDFFNIGKDFHIASKATYFIAH
jgi:hypothetical protein